MNENQLHTIDNVKPELCALQPIILQNFLRKHNFLNNSECNIINVNQTDVGKILDTLNIIQPKFGSWDVLIQFLRLHQCFNLADRMEISAGPIPRPPQSHPPPVVITPQPPIPVVHPYPPQPQPIDPDPKPKNCCRTCCCKFGIVFGGMVSLTLIILLAVLLAPKEYNSDDTPSIQEVITGMVKWPCNFNGTKATKCPMRSNQCAFSNSEYGGFCNCTFGVYEYCMYDMDCCNSNCVNGQCADGGGTPGSICLTSAKSGTNAGCASGVRCVEHFVDRKESSQKYGICYKN